MNYTMKCRQFPPKTPKQIKKERRQFINEFLDGNLRRFLRKNYKNYRNQLVFSKDLKKWDKQGKSNLVKLLKKHYEWPKHICEVVNVVKTLTTYYGMELNKITIDRAVALIDLFEDDMYDYHRVKYKDKYSKGLPLNIKITPEEALREQKARGFIHINYFEDYDREFSHVYSTVNDDYVYPINFPHKFRHHNDKIPSDYIGQSIVGVEGFTRIDIPNV